VIEKEKTFMPSHVRKLGGVLALVSCLTTGYIAGQAIAAQEHMHEARQHLQQARSELQRAENDKGGHRTKAMDLVDRAISEVNEGMAHSRRR